MDAISVMSRSNPPFGSWPSPFSAARVTAGALRLDQIQLDGEDVYWIEGRASEGGRSVIVKRSSDGEMSDMTPPGFNVRTRVHEYGGGAYTVDEGTIYFSNFADQRIYRQQPGKDPVAITDEGPFFADYRVDRFRNRLIAVRETPVKGSEHKNDLVAIGIPTGVPEQVLVEGADFYSDPIVSPDGKFIAWLQWHHPNMPWDGTELWVAVFNADGSVGSREKVAGGASESIFQPEWSPDSSLYFVSDRTGWWNLYRWRGIAIEPVHPMAAEFGKPQWTFSMVTYAIIDANRIAATYTQGGRWKLALIDVDARAFTPIDLPIEPLESIKANAHGDLFHRRIADGVERDRRDQQPAARRALQRAAIGGDRIDPTRVDFGGGGGHLQGGRPRCARLLLRADESRCRRRQVRAIAAAAARDHAWRSDRGDDRCARSEDPVLDQPGLRGARRELQRQHRLRPAVSRSPERHSGASSTSRTSSPARRRWWREGKADPERLIIRGGSAGGYTTLAALTFHDTFKSGASYYGISDLEVLQQDTHKFESRYNDSLIGPYPEARDIYRARSPIHFTDRLACPIILFQGLEDKVVPPNQSEMMAEAVREEGVEGEVRDLRRRAARFPQGREHHPFARGGTGLLPGRVRAGLAARSSKLYCCMVI